MSTTRETILHCLSVHDPAREAIRWGDQIWTIGELTSNATQWAVTLKEYIQPGEIVVCDYQEDPFEYMALFLGVMAAGGIHLSTRDRNSTWNRLNRIGASWNAVSRIAPQPHEIAALDGLRLVLAPDAQVLLVQTPSKGSTSDSAEPGRILETSGSTGEPKWVYWTEQDLLADRRSWIEELALTTADKVLNLHPLDFAHGIDVHVLPALMIGALLIHRNIRIDNKAEIAADLTVHGITMMSALPSHYTSIAVCCTAPNAGQSVRMALVGGALLSPASVQMVYRRTGLQLKRLYGATEAGIMCADLKRDEQSLPRLRPMSGVSMTIRPLSNVISAVFPTVGEPYFRRTHMARSYWGDPERTASAFSDGWYKSGDAVICNDDGSVAVLGRVDDVWINPDSEVMHSSGEVSASLVDVEGVTEVAVIPPKGEALSLATVFCTVDPNAHLKKVEAEIASILSAAGVRANIYLSNEWPRTLVGKPDRRALLAWVQ